VLSHKAVESPENLHSVFDVKFCPTFLSFAGTQKGFINICVGSRSNPAKFFIKERRVNGMVFTAI